ncbi:glucose-1-phosphate adenylyltransferase [bacterium]|nr:glucose-1-phosphate adenylyltransferase [bacterium]
MHNTIAIIMAGGAGSRLYPLTKMRAKPAVPIAGKFRLIDIPISNCLNSGLRQMFVLTQFNSESLNRHLSRTFFFSPFSSGFVQILAAQQTIEHTDWYQGTADSVRKNLQYFMGKHNHFHLILAGDHLYSMDYQKLLAFHVEQNADITVGVLPVLKQQAAEFGILKLDKNSRITRFIEKPRTDSALKPFAPAQAWLKENNLEGEDIYLGSMGIYLFSRKVLEELLEGTVHADFGKGIIPHAINGKRVFGYLFRGYWEDVGTIESFYRAMMDLVAPIPKFNFYAADRPIYTRPRYLPGAKVTGCHLIRSVINEGAILEECTIEDSMIGLRARIKQGARISRSVIMGRDYFENPEDHEENQRLGRPDASIGRDCVIEKAIIDKNARIGNGVQILDRNRGENKETENWVIREGIVIVPKDAVIEPGTVIG